MQPNSIYCSIIVTLHQTGDKLFMMIRYKSYVSLPKPCLWVKAFAVIIPIPLHDGYAGTYQIAVL